MAKIGFMGMGNMGTAIMRGLLKTYKPEELLFTECSRGQNAENYRGDGRCPCFHSDRVRVSGKISGPRGKASGAPDGV